VNTGVSWQNTELRTSDLRFSYAEAAEFLNQVMGPNLFVECISALERVKIGFWHQLAISILITLPIENVWR
jgi:LuxR family maltose regulon positive regulatory protein